MGVPMTEPRLGPSSTPTTQPTARSAAQGTRVFWPFFIGTDNPISYLYGQIAPHFGSTEFDVTVLSSNDGNRSNGNRSNGSRSNGNRSNGGRNDGSRPAPDNVRVIPSAAYNSWAGRLTVARHALEQYDLIHTGGIPLLHYPVALLSRLRNREGTFVHTYRIDADPDSDRTPTGVRRRLGKQADVTTAVSEHTAGTVRSTFGLDPVVVYNAVDTDLFHPDYDHPVIFEEYAPERPVFLFVGTFEKRKNPLDVLAVAEQVPEASFLLVGGGGETARDAAVADRAASLDNAHVVGRLPKQRLPALYSNAAGFLFPSTMEGCPNVVLEAFASATPVVGYDATSMPELVADGQRGYLADVGDIEGLVDGVESILADPTNRLGRNARGYVCRNHTFDIVAGQYAAVYREALDS